jgi:serine/threonine protein kinase
VDIWSIGCVFAELILQVPIFPGDNPQHQFEIIVAKLGCPPIEDSQHFTFFVTFSQYLMDVFQIKQVISEEVRSIVLYR